MYHHVATLQDFYRRGEFSDMRIEIPGYYGSVELDAHKVILAAKSGYFRRELKLPKYNEGKVATLEMDSSLSPNAMHTGILALYGFDFMDEHYETEKPTELGDFVEICVVAVQYEIEGLFDSMLEAVSQALTKCLSLVDDDDNEFDITLDEFLGSEWSGMLHEPRFPPLVFKLLKEHLPKMYNRRAFQDLLTKEPLLARCLLDGMMEAQE